MPLKTLAKNDFIENERIKLSFLEHNLKSSNIKFQFEDKLTNQKEFLNFSMGWWKSEVNAN